MTLPNTQDATQQDMLVDLLTRALDEARQFVRRDVKIPPLSRAEVERILAAIEASFGSEQPEPKLAAWQLRVMGNHRAVLAHLADDLKGRGEHTYAFAVGSILDLMDAAPTEQGGEL